jgi:uncharacterized RDD family membrane protein YckC
MFCSQCGTQLQPDRKLCPKCGKSESAANTAISQIHPPSPSYKPPIGMLRQGDDGQKLKYAGFWVRFIAYMLDGLILGGGISVIIILATLISVRLERISTIASGIFMSVVILITIGLSIGYNIYFWGRYGATPGKMAMGHKIIRDDGVEPLGYGKAFIRWLGYIASGSILSIGFIMIGFTDRKRGLHDMIAGTTVVKVR